MSPLNEAPSESACRGVQGAKPLESFWYCYGVTRYVATLGISNLSVWRPEFDLGAPHSGLHFAELVWGEDLLTLTIERDGTVDVSANAVTRIERPGSAAARESHR